MHDAAVLVITSLEDVTSDLVITELNRRGVPVVRLDPADIGRDVTFAAHIGGRSAGWNGRVAVLDRDVDLTRVRSVYHRRPGPWRFADLPQQAREFASAEARYGFGGLLASTPARYVNHPAANARAEYKPSQLSAAVDLGFAVPATLITNDLHAVRAFEAEHGALIYKTFRSVPVIDGQAGVVWAQRIDASDVDESVSVTAHMFQAEVDKTCDARVTLVGSQVFAVVITAPGTPLDWRSGDWDQLEYSPIEVPDSIVKRLRAYLDRFGLAFGCFDFAIDRHQGWHWIECNPNGQWGFLPDADAIADAFAALLQAG